MFYDETPKKELEKSKTLEIAVLRRMLLLDSLNRPL